ncbi:hypothetical protein MCOR25_002948 [Pyricularia grisea]|nr:hypothetical protein MCOR25_002948 [Pyricularia grisea]
MGSGVIIVLIGVFPEDISDLRLCHGCCPCSVLQQQNRKQLVFLKFLHYDLLGFRSDFQYLQSISVIHLTPILSSPLRISRQFVSFFYKSNYNFIFPRKSIQSNLDTPNMLCDPFPIMNQ